VYINGAFKPEIILWGKISQLESKTSIGHFPLKGIEKGNLFLTLLQPS